MISWQFSNVTPNIRPMIFFFNFLVLNSEIIRILLPFTNLILARKVLGFELVLLQSDH